MKGLNQFQKVTPWEPATTFKQFETLKQVDVSEVKQYPLCFHKNERHLPHVSTFPERLQDKVVSTIISDGLSPSEVFYQKEYITRFVEKYHFIYCR